MSLEVLPAFLVEKAFKELNESVDTRMEKIEQLREKAKQIHGFQFDLTDKGLIMFLRPRKFDVDRALELMVRYHEAKRDNPDIYENFTPSSEKLTFESGWNVAFPNRDADGRRIIAVRPGNWNPEERTILNNLRSNLIAIEILLQEETTQINGVVLIIDFRNFGFTQAKAMQPTIFKRYGGLVFNTYPIRIKGIHVLEQPAIFNIIFPIISYFMKEKVKERVKLHGGNYNALKEYITADVLPQEYGGTAGPLEMRVWVKQVIDAEEELEHLWT